MTSRQFYWLKFAKILYFSPSLVTNSFVFLFFFPHPSVPHNKVSMVLELSQKKPKKSYPACNCCIWYYNTSLVLLISIKHQSASSSSSSVQQNLTFQWLGKYPPQFRKQIFRIPPANKLQPNSQNNIHKTTATENAEK